MISPIPSTNSSGGQSYTDSPFTSTGRPALGLAIIGTLAYSAIFLTKGTNSLGPLEQLRPTASAPILCNTITAISNKKKYNLKNISNGFITYFPLKSCSIRFSNCFC